MAKKSLKPAAKLSGSLLKIGRGSRAGESAAPKVKAAPPEPSEAPEALEPAPPPPPLPEPPAPEAAPSPESLTPETVKPEAPAAAKPDLDLAAFDGAIPELLKAEAEPPLEAEAPAEEIPAEDSEPQPAPPAPAEPAPEEPAPRLLDQFDWLRSKNAELARKESERRAARRPAPRSSLVEKPLEKPAGIGALDPTAPAAAAKPDPGTKAGLDQFLRNLRAGQFGLAESHFAQVMNLEPRLAKRILYNAELEDLAVICRALGLRSLEFATIVALLRGARPKGGFSASEGLKGSLGIFESVDREGALKLMEFIPELPQRDWSELKRL